MVQTIATATVATNERGDTVGTFNVMPRSGRAAERNWTDFATRYPAEAAWLELESRDGGAFASSLIRGCRRYGGLTPRQLAAVQRSLTVNAAVESLVGRDVPAATATAPNGQISGPSGDDYGPADDGTAPLSERDGFTFGGWINTAGPAAINPPDVTESLRAQTRATGTAAVVIAPTPAPAVTIEADAVRRAMDSAAASGLRKVRLTLGNVTFKLSGSRWRHGTGMILCYFNGSYRGWIDRNNVWHAPGRVWMDSATGGDAIQAFRAAAADPQAAARTHGLDTGYCSCCRRLLTDPPSVMAGIGPICIRRFGWAF